MKLGKIIKDYREKNKITMQELADKAGVSKGYISMVENEINPSTGKPITPSLTTYRSLARAMNMQLDDLLNLVDPDTPVKIPGNDDPYYLNPESARIAQEAFENPNLRILFDAARNVDPEDLKYVIDLVKRLEREENPDPADYPDEVYDDDHNQDPGEY